MQTESGENRLYEVRDTSTPASAEQRSTDVQRCDDPAIQYGARPWSDSRHRAVVRSSRQPLQLVSRCFYQLRRIKFCQSSANGSRKNSSQQLCRLKDRLLQQSVGRRCTYQLDRLQAVMNTAARLIYGVGKFDRIQRLISDRLHWLPVHKRVQFKLCLLAYKAVMA